MRCCKVMVLTNSVMQVLEMSTSLLWVLFLNFRIRSMFSVNVFILLIELNSAVFAQM